MVIRVISLAFLSILLDIIIENFKRSDSLTLSGAP